jgi:hypothetical protein
VCMHVCGTSVLMKEWFLLFIDTESSYGGGESPILIPRRRKSHSASCCLLGLTPGGSLESGNSTSLDVGMLVYTHAYNCSYNRVSALLAVVTVNLILHCLKFRSCNPWLQPFVVRDYCGFGFCALNTLIGGCL